LAVAAAAPTASAAALAAAEPARGRYASPFAKDPFAVSLDDKLAALIAADEAMGIDPRVTLRQARFAAYREEKAFASTEGGACAQTLTECGGGISCEAVARGESQTRSFPGSQHGGVMQAGYERFESLALDAEAPRVAEEAIALLTAAPCPPGRSALILDGEQTALQVHESVGHATELDRVLGREASYAGTSFLDPAGLGSFRYGSELMNVTADATVAGGLGTAGWDDEGVAARAEPLVRDGVLSGFLSSRETAAEIGRAASAGCMRASGFDRQPIVRMTNVNLEPGDAGSLADLIADTDSGIYMETNRSWSIDNRRLNFQFGTEAAWEIEDGERRRLLRNPSYAGVTPEFWAKLDAVCSRPEWRLWGVLNCGKGEPGQAVHVSHGAAPTRFRDVEVGVA
ncbi:MAG: TldD/PmbA family protein, partial [Thermoleophilaceae bacterium]|nr:TldD/PmbA family protein [Thermoleophilaceae bacterium]